MKSPRRITKWFRKYVLRKKVLTPQEEFKLEQRDFVAQLLKSTMMFFELLREAQRRLKWSRSKRKQAWKDLLNGYLDDELVKVMEAVIRPILVAARSTKRSDWNE